MNMAVGIGRAVVKYKSFRPVFCLFYYVFIKPAFFPFLEEFFLGGL